MRLASKEDFFNGPIYTDYRHHEGYAKRAKLFRDFPEKILIVGSGFGFLVTELRKLGKETWGIDASAWAWEHRDNDYVWCSDILNPSKVDILRQQLGSFATVITEDLLPCLTDEEAKIANFNCRLLGRIVIHMVTEKGEADLNYHSPLEWMNLTGQPAISLEGM